MDLSKLPKLSDTKSHIDTTVELVEPLAVIDLPEQIPPTHIRNNLILTGCWLHIVFGVFFLLCFPRFLQWLSSEMFHTHFDQFMLNGNVVPYQSLPVFWSDLGPTLFGIVLILDGLLSYQRRPLIALVAFNVTFIATGFNLDWLIYSYLKYGLAAVSLIATFAGVPILYFQRLRFRTLQQQMSEPGLS